MAWLPNVKPWDPTTYLPSRKRLLNRKEITRKMKRLEGEDYLLFAYYHIVAIVFCKIE
jgi:hypothetical protein